MSDNIQDVINDNGVNALDTAVENSVNEELRKQMNEEYDL